MTELQSSMPPGWDCKLDEKSGKYYFVNHYTRTTTWEDPRNRHRHFQGTPKHFTNVQQEYIPMQHGSPDLRRNYIYPSQTTPIPAFQMPAHMSPKSVCSQDMMPRMSPLTVRSSKIQDSSLTIISDTDEAVAKIAAMFPTVSETHLRMLLKNCRYMKSIFPQADETMILEILQNNESNIQKTSEVLKDMGFERKDTVKVAQQKLEAKREEERREVEMQSKPPTPPPKIKTAQEKKKMKADLQNEYKDVAEHLITIALESVNFNQSRANQILQIMIQEDNQTSEPKKKEEVQTAVDHLDVPSTSSAVTAMPVSQSRQSLKSLLKSEKEMDKVSYSRIIEDNGNGYRSPNLSNTKGPDVQCTKGANEDLLLEDYVKWQGPNTSLVKGPQGLEAGPNVNILCSRPYQPCGPNKELRKGPKFGLAKGSIFSQLKTVVGESRVK